MNVAGHQFPRVVARPFESRQDLFCGVASEVLELGVRVHLNQGLAAAGAPADRVACGFAVNELPVVAADETAEADHSLDVTA